MYKTPLLLSLLLLVTAAKATGLASRKTRQRSYTEDLARHRIKFAPTQVDTTPKPAKKYKAKKLTKPLPTQDITQQLHDLLVDLKAYYAMTDSVQGYTIQVYVGGSREQAFQARHRLYTCYPTLNPEVQYKQPNFTVRIGRFLDRLEAYKLYVAIKAMMPQAIIRPAYFPSEPDIFNASSAVRAPASKHSLGQEQDQAYSDTAK